MICQCSPHSFWCLKSPWCGRWNHHVSCFSMMISPFKIPIQNLGLMLKILIWPQQTLLQIPQTPRVFHHQTPQSPTPPALAKTLTTSANRLREFRWGMSICGKNDMEYIYIYISYIYISYIYISYIYISNESRCILMFILEKRTDMDLVVN